MSGSIKPPTEMQQLIEVLTSIAGRLCEIRDLLSRREPAICRTCTTRPCPFPRGPQLCEGWRP